MLVWQCSWKFRISHILEKRKTWNLGFLFLIVNMGNARGSSYQASNYSIFVPYYFEVVIMRHAQHISESSTKVHQTWRTRTSQSQNYKSCVFRYTTHGTLIIIYTVYNKYTRYSYNVNTYKRYSCICMCAKLICFGVSKFFNPK